MAENFEWESAGYFWESGILNNIIDTLVPEDQNGVDEVTKIINEFLSNSKYEERRQAYEYIKKIIN